MESKLMPSKITACVCECVRVVEIYTVVVTVFLTSCLQRMIKVIETLHHLSHSERVMNMQPLTEYH